jgi:hypothetical protein
LENWRLRNDFETSDRDFYSCARNGCPSDEGGDIFAYESTGSDQFGTIDLNTGAFSLIGLTTSGGGNVLLTGLGEIGSAIYGGLNGGSTLYQVNPSTGALTTVGNGSSNYLDTGSTLTALYGLDSNLDLFP